MKCFLFCLFYKRNGKRCSCATIELWIHLGGLLSNQEARVALGNSYASSVLSRLHAARLPSTFTSGNRFIHQFPASLFIQVDGKKRDRLAGDFCHSSL